MLVTVLRTIVWRTAVSSAWMGTISQASLVTNVPHIVLNVLAPRLAQSVNMEDTEQNVNLHAEHNALIVWAPLVVQFVFPVDMDHIASFIARLAVLICLVTKQRGSVYLVADMDTTESRTSVIRVRKTARDVLTIPIVPYVSKDFLEITVSGRAPQVVETKPVIKNLDYVLGDVLKDIFLKALTVQVVPIDVLDAVTEAAVRCARLVTGDKHARRIVLKFVTNVVKMDSASVVSWYSRTSISRSPLWTTKICLRQAYFG